VDGVPTPAATLQPVFYYDLGDPECYLVAERIMSSLRSVPEWEPVLASAMEPAGSASEPGWREQLEHRALKLGIQPLRWPAVWPPDSRDAMLAATYAKRIGRAVAFSLAAFRQAFAGGRDLGDQDTILIAGAACEMHPSALLKGIALRSNREALTAAVRRARQAGVRSLPAIAVGDALFQGEGALEAATATLETTGAAIKPA
jgi:2-hydroxychromene-2-carboxylate isomerase